MWESDAVFSQGCACFFPRQYLCEKLVGSRDAAGFFEQTRELPDCMRSPARSQLQCDPSFIQNVGERDGHREKLDYSGEAVIQLIQELWQQKTSRPPRKTKQPFRCNGASTIRVMSMPCRISIA